MSFGDFAVKFANLYICHLFSDTWHHVVCNGEWRGESAAGCANFKRWFDNPQFIVTIEADSQLFFQLTQEERRAERDSYHIAFSLHQKEGRKAKRCAQFAAPLLPYANTRSATMSITRLEPGVYTLVASTYKPDLEATFRVEVYSDTP